MIGVSRFVRSLFVERRSYSATEITQRLRSEKVRILGVWWHGGKKGGSWHEPPTEDVTLYGTNSQLLTLIPKKPAFLELEINLNACGEGTALRFKVSGEQPKPYVFLRPYLDA